ncbi:hypothetical protein Tco_1143392 [Tanacetum coccineum]
MGPEYPSSRWEKYISLAVEYLSKWDEARRSPLMMPRCLQFLKTLFSRFGATPEFHKWFAELTFAIDQFTKVMLKYGCHDRLSPKHINPRRSGKLIGVKSREFKVFLREPWEQNRLHSWSDKLDDAFMGPSQHSLQNTHRMALHEDFLGQLNPVGLDMSPLSKYSRIMKALDSVIFNSSFTSSASFWEFSPSDKSSQTSGYCITVKDLSPEFVCAYVSSTVYTQVMIIDRT